MTRESNLFLNGTIVRRGPPAVSILCADPSSEGVVSITIALELESPLPLMPAAAAAAAAAALPGISC